jgi:hypothetical protein
MKEEYQSAILLSWQGGWESVSGSPDVYIFQAYDGKYYLLACYYDKDYGRGSFTCYDIDSDEDGLYIGIGVKHYRLLPEESPYGLHIGEWGSYMKN